MSLASDTPIVHQLHVQMHNRIFLDAQGRCVQLMQALRPVDAIQAGLTPILVYAVVVQGFGVCYATAAAWPDKPSLRGFLGRAWTIREEGVDPAPLIWGLPDRLVVSSRILNGCPALGPFVAHFGVELAQSDPKDKSYNIHQGLVQRLQPALDLYTDTTHGNAASGHGDPLPDIARVRRSMEDAERWAFSGAVRAEVAGRLPQRSSDPDRRIPAGALSKLQTMQERRDWDNDESFLLGSSRIPARRPAEVASMVLEGQRWRSGQGLLEGPSDNYDPPHAEHHFMSTIRAQAGSLGGIVNAVRPQLDAADCPSILSLDGRAQMRSMLACWPASKADVAREMGVSTQDLERFLSGEKGLPRDVVSQGLGLLNLRIAPSSIGCDQPWYDPVGPCILRAPSIGKTRGPGSIAKMRDLNEAYVLLTHGGDVDRCFEITTQGRGLAGALWRYVLVMPCSGKDFLMVFEGSDASSAILDKVGAENILLNYEGPVKVSAGLYQAVCATWDGVRTTPKYMDAIMRNFSLANEHEREQLRFGHA